MDTTYLLTLLQHCLPIILGGGFGVLVVWMLASKGKDPVKDKYLGFAVMAVRWAEKLIPDNTPNSHMAKADEALKAFLALVDKYGDKGDFKDGAEAWFVEMKERILLDLQSKAIVPSPAFPVTATVSTVTTN